MKKSQNTTALLLMVLSLILLTASQYFWLKSEYADQKRTFYTHSNLLFKETVRSLEDSLISRSIVRSLRINDEADSLQQSEETNTITRRNGGDRPDSVVDQDSLRKTRRVLAQIPGVAFRVQGNRGLQLRRRFDFKSAPLDSVQAKFGKRMLEMGYNVDFEVKKDSIPLDSGSRRSFRTFTEMHKKFSSAEDSIQVNGVSILNPDLITSFSILPNIMFEAHPKFLNKYLLSKLATSLIFSCFLLLITGLAFFFIYRNLQRQARLNQLKDDLIANVSHELKTPLATISVALEALMQFGGKENPETTKEYLSISRNEVSRLSHMVDNILQTSLLEKETLPINTQTLDLRRLSEEVVKSWQPRFRQMEGSLDFSSIGEDFKTEADEQLVAGVINNLIDNAVKYSKETPEVKVEIAAAENHIALSVSDKGIGISKEFQSQIFDKFFRVPTGDKHNVKGYGLGLNFVKHIMDLHHGNVSLKSSDAGTEFLLTFNK